MFDQPTITTSDDVVTNTFGLTVLTNTTAEVSLTMPKATPPVHVKVEFGGELFECNGSSTKDTECITSRVFTSAGNYTHSVNMSQQYRGSVQYNMDIIVTGERPV